MARLDGPRANRVLFVGEVPCAHRSGEGVCARRKEAEAMGWGRAIGLNSVALAFRNRGDETGEDCGLPPFAEDDRLKLATDACAGMGEALGELDEMYELPGCPPASGDAILGV